MIVTFRFPFNISYCSQPVIGVLYDVSSNSTWIFSRIYDIKSLQGNLFGLIQSRQRSQDQCNSFVFLCALLAPFLSVSIMWKHISFPLVFSELFALVKHQFSDLILGLSLSQSILDSIAARFNNKAGKLNFDDFLQIICRIYSLKGMLNGSKNQFDNVDILCCFPANHNRSSHKCTNHKRGFVHTLRGKSLH